MLFPNQQAGGSFFSEFLADTEIAIFGSRLNPHRAFSEELGKQASKLRVSLAGVHTQIGRRPPDPDNPGIILALPRRGEFYRVFGRDFREFLIKVRDHPEQSHDYRKLDGGIDVAFTYTPGERHSSGGYPNYLVALSPTRNSLANSLARKAKQLKRAGAEGATVLFVCDGGSQSIRAPLGGSLSRYDAPQIVNRFLKNRSISMICLLVIERTSSPHSLVPFSGPLEIRASCYFHRTLPEERARQFGTVAERLTEVMPLPENDAVNAVNWLRSRGGSFGRSFYGGSTVSDSVKISARALQDLLAGNVELKSFLEDHGWIPGRRGSVAVNPFAVKLKQGRLIERVSVEPCPDRDDDWLVFEFSGLDAAISPFHAPEPPR